jgi:cation diffusion facilitator family transporter
MNTHDLSEWSHDHVFDKSNETAERSTKLVMWITVVMMAVEILAGWAFNSMSLLADGWHMSSHALAIGLSAMAYVTARTYAHDPRFAFGTWKIEVLAGFTSALCLVGVAVAMVIGSLERLISPQAIAYPEAIAVGVLGLLVNIVCAVILGKAHHHDHHEHAHQDQAHPHDHSPHHDHHHGHHHSHHHDLNLASAYLHVVADAFTSVLAIVALLGGWFYGWSWLDPVMGIVGAVLVALWAKNLVIDTGKVLLDREMDHPVVDEIRDVVQADGQTQVADLHVWRVGKKAYACAMSLVTRDAALTPSQVRDRLRIHEEIIHSTIEIHQRP